MAFQLSPGVNVSEIDLTTIVPAVGTTEAAFAGHFQWGPLEQIVTVSNEVELVDRFGKPDSNTFISFFSAANFLGYGRNLKLVRAANTTVAKNAVAGATPVLIKNRDNYEQSYINMSASGTAGNFTARYPGELGNGLVVTFIDTATGYANSNASVYAKQFNSAPGTSAYAARNGKTNDELHILITDGAGKFTGVPNTVLEKFSYISKWPDAKNDDGSTNYYVNVINEQSKYVYVTGHANNTWGNTSTTNFSNTTFGWATATLAGGVQGAPTDANLQTAYDKFKNSEEVDISLIITGGASQLVSEYIVDNIAEYRKDCVAFVSPQSANVVNNTGNEVTASVANRNLYNSSSYAFMDSGWKYQFDKYNNVYRWVPLNGDIAGLCVRTDFDRDPWFSPAGFNRGAIKNVVKLSWNPNKTERDDLYKAGINPVVSFPGQGVILYGDKTMLDKPSAFDRINVRRLFIVLEKAIARASKYSLFQFNDEFTRAQFVSLVEPFLRDVKGRRGIYDYRVVCNETNNTPEVIDRNEFVGDIYIKPARSINFIQLNFIAVRTGIAFEEIVGRF